jgi:hypothetical protein
MESSSTPIVRHQDTETEDLQFTHTEERGFYTGGQEWRGDQLVHLVSDQREIIGGSFC